MVLAPLDWNRPSAAQEEPDEGISKETAPCQIVNGSWDLAAEDQSVHDGVRMVGRENRRSMGRNVTLSALLDIQEEEANSVAKSSSEG